LGNNLVNNASDEESLGQRIIEEMTWFMYGVVNDLVKFDRENCLVESTGGAA